MVERAKAIGQITSLVKLDQKDGTALLKLIPDEHNQQSVGDYDWEIAREAIEYVFGENVLAEDFTAHILMDESKKDRAKPRNNNRNNLSNQIQRMIKSNEAGDEASSQNYCVVTTAGSGLIRDWGR